MRRPSRLIPKQWLLAEAIRRSNGRSFMAEHEYPSSLRLRDDRVAYIETLASEQQLHEPDKVAVYLKVFEQLRAAAIIGSERRDIGYA